MPKPEQQTNAEIDELCPHYRRATTLLGKRWTGLILRVLCGGPTRFSDIGGAVQGLSDRMLSARLRELEAAGLVERTVYAAVPVRVEYRLTPMGDDLTPILEALQQWAQDWAMAETSVA